MQDFRMSGTSMNQLMELMEKIQEDMEETHRRVERLTKRIEQEGRWTGPAQETFLAYMELLQAYHGSFTNKSTARRGNPIQEAVTALKAHAERTDSFYTDFPEYKEMEKMN